MKTNAAMTLAQENAVLRAALAGMLAAFDVPDQYEGEERRSWMPASVRAAALEAANQAITATQESA